MPYRSRHTHSRPHQVHQRGGFFVTMGRALDLGPVPGDENLGKQPSPTECFSTLTPAQIVGSVLVTLMIGALGFAILAGSFALSAH